MIHTSHTQAAKTADCESEGICGDETSGEEAKSLQQRREVGEGSARKNLQKKKRKKAERTPKRPSHPRAEAVLMKPVEGMSDAFILRKLKKRVNPDELGVTVQGIRETRCKDVLVKLKSSKKDIEQLDTAFKKAVDPPDRD